MKTTAFFNLRRFLNLVALIIIVTQSIGVQMFALPQTQSPVNNVNQTTPSFKEIKQIKAGVLDIGYADVGPANGQPVILLHGWPYDINSFADVATILAAKGYRVYVPYLRGFGSTRFLSESTPRNSQQ